METKKQFKIAILEDSKFYNQLLTRQLENYTNELAHGKEYSFDIQSYTNSYDFLQNLKDDIDIAFIDYYLGSEKTGIDVLKEIKERNPNCKVIMISQAKTFKTSLLSVLEGASEFIFKDKNALARSCFIVEDIVNEQLQKDKNHAN